MAAFSRYAELALPFNEGTPLVSPEEKYRRAAAALADDQQSPHGPARGGYRLTLRFVEDFYPSRSGTLVEQNGETAEETDADDAEAAYDEEAALGEFAGVLDSLDADLVTVWPHEARWLGKSGVLLPLDRFNRAGDSGLRSEFYPYMLDQFRSEGALYALPIGASPLMLFYDEMHFMAQGVPPVNASWDWDDLVENAVRLTTRKEDGTVARWGLVAHEELIWWALWQNGAALMDLDTLQCRLPEPAELEALQFVHDLMHKHGVTPVASSEVLRDLTWNTPPAMLYSHTPWHRNQKGFRMAPLPRGKERSVPVRAAFGLAIATRTQKTEAAYTALRGFTHAMQGVVAIPGTRTAVARLADLRKDLNPDEVAAVQQSLDHGREWPQERLQVYAMVNLTGRLSRGDDVATAVNVTCSLVREYQETGKLSFPE